MLAVYHLDLSLLRRIFAGKLSGTRKSPLLYFRRYSLENFDECLTITRCETRPLELKSQASVIISQMFPGIL
ncbi:hypothetical protein HAX54_041366 [Datura stramonium]|uniref:Uncharacterized protein n=1 Tax=Datura stramonium TaxID=4076 RepID=A0ABS8VR99_DATST|nr:hypothetical protein [Datura stramonium]